MSKVIIDQNKCIGCNTCALLCPEYFELDSDTYKAKVTTQPEKINDEIQTAIDSCPVTAISVTEEK